MIDIDHFKSYNDSFRHQQGDVALTTVAEKVRKLSDPDVAIRYGGEEFSVILVGYDDPNRKVREHGEAIRGGIERIVVMPFSTHAIINILCNQVKIPKRMNQSAKAHMTEFFEDNTVCAGNYDDALEQYFGMFPSSLYDSIISTIMSLQRITASIGGASRNPGESLTELLDRADEAPYQPKHAGRNRAIIAQ